MKDVQTTAFAPVFTSRRVAIGAANAGNSASATAHCTSAASSPGPSYQHNGKLEVEAEMKSVHQIYEIAEVRSTHFGYMYECVCVFVCYITLTDTFLAGWTEAILIIYVIYANRNGLLSALFCYSCFTSCTSFSFSLPSIVLASTVLIAGHWD
jgi:hypothetical protein